jgi:hypothetical protein
VIARTDILAAAALAIAVAGGVLAWLERPGRVDVPPGRSDPGSYVVQALAAGEAEPLQGGAGETLLPVARFETRGRILHMERFSAGKSLSNWVPGLRSSTHDIGLGYGPMTDSANVDLFTYAHDGALGGRWLIARPVNAAAGARMEELAPSITNVHVIPANDAIAARIARLKIGELVTLRGLLVNVRYPGGQVATTSTTAGDRACEIVWVTAVEASRLR